MAEKQWFESWFDTSYYHTLYKDRNDEEAQLFMTHLASFLDIKKEDQLLDLACGKGRHSFFLNNLGYQIEGCDLSNESIDFANSKANGKPHFYVHDMRDSLPSGRYNFILNLFTSFGYFDDLADNLKVLNAIKLGLKSKGKAVIDFLNVHHVSSHLIPYEEKQIDGITFKISKEITSDHIVKDIRFTVDNIHHEYQEKVQALELTDFEHLAKEAGLKIEHSFGDYQLNSFNSALSNRLILVLSHE
jgi:SAM-dependent methyltransferase